MIEEFSKQDMLQNEKILLEFKEFILVSDSKLMNMTVVSIALYYALSTLVLEIGKGKSWKLLVFEQGLFHHKNLQNNIVQGFAMPPFIKW